MGCLKKVANTVHRNVEIRLEHSKVGRVIKLQRDVRGIGLREAARQMNVSHATLRRVERGGMPDIPTLYALFKYYKWSKTDLAWFLKSLATREKPGDM